MEIRKKSETQKGTRVQGYKSILKKMSGGGVPTKIMLHKKKLYPLYPNLGIVIFKKLRALMHEVNIKNNEVKK